MTSELDDIFTQEQFAEMYVCTYISVISSLECTYFDKCIRDLSTPSLMSARTEDPN